MSDSDGMTDFPRLCEVFDIDVAEKVKKRNTGGVSGKKGGLYEIRYAGYLVAKYATVANATIAMQVFEFVDDVQITCPNGFECGLTKVDFQLKDRASLGWNELDTDFGYQFNLNQANSQANSNQVVVVTRETVAKNLKDQMPKSIEKHSEVRVFPNDVLGRLLMESEEVRQAIQEICAFPEEQDKLEHVYTLISGELLNQPNNCRVLIKDILGKARALNPSFIRVGGDWVIPGEVRKVLDGIDGFGYEINFGFFKWWYGAAMEGVLAYGCDDSKYSDFCALIVRQNPLNFDELEPHLN